MADEYMRIPESLVPLSILALDLLPSTAGWEHDLAEQGIAIQKDDLGRRCISRAAARHLFEERELAEQRAREIAEARDVELERQRAQVWGGIRAGAIPDGLTPAEYLMMSGEDERPRRRSVIEDALAGTDMVLREIRQEVEDWS